MDICPNDKEAHRQEREQCHLYNKMSADEESFYRQRSRIQWLPLGDKNTTFFHRSLIHRRSRNRIHSLRRPSGEITRDSMEMGNLAVDYFHDLLSQPYPTLSLNTDVLYAKAISREQRDAMAGPVTREEIKEALFSIPDDKAPGPDGFNNYFFKESRAIVGNDFTAAVLHFFRTSSLPKCISAMRITLILKVANPDNLGDYRPISCCTVVYKCIAKILAKRLKSSLAGVISRAQSAFLPGRNISEAIFLVQEIMHNYHRKEGPPAVQLRLISGKPLTRSVRTSSYRL